MNSVRGLLLSWYLKCQVTDAIPQCQQNSHIYLPHISTENRCVRNCIPTTAAVQEPICPRVCFDWSVWWTSAVFVCGFSLSRLSFSSSLNRSSFLSHLNSMQNSIREKPDFFWERPNFTLGESDSPSLTRALTLTQRLSHRGSQFLLESKNLIVPM